VWRLDGREHGTTEVLPLGNRAAAVASVLFLGEDGSIVIGDAAERRSLTDPDRVVREFKRRIGDDTPIFVGGYPYPAHDLAATMIRWVVERVTEREGGPPNRVAITHPAGWGAYKKELMRTALVALGVEDTIFLPEPEAAAISYAAQERVAAGATIAVYDLGGGTFDAAVVRKTDDDTFVLLGSADGLDHLGGADFDEAVFTHVRAGLGADFDALDFQDPGVLSSVALLRRECTEAKEALSSDTEVSIPALLPGINSHVRLGRGEFEEMIRPALEDTVESLSRAIRSADITSDDLAAVLLVGGSSRVPLVSQLVSAELGRPVVVDADPKTTVALGAALWIGAQPVAAEAAEDAAESSPDTLTLAPVAADADEEPVTADDQPTIPPRIPDQRRPHEYSEASRRRKLLSNALFGMAPTALIGGVLLGAFTLTPQDGWQSLPDVFGHSEAKPPSAEAAPKPARAPHVLAAPQAAARPGAAPSTEGVSPAANSKTSVAGSLGPSRAREVVPQERSGQNPPMAAEANAPVQRPSWLYPQRQGGQPAHGGRVTAPARPVAPPDTAQEAARPSPGSAQNPQQSASDAQAPPDLPPPPDSASEPMPLPAPQPPAESDPGPSDPAPSDPGPSDPAPSDPVQSEPRPLPAPEPAPEPDPSTDPSTQTGQTGQPGQSGQPGESGSAVEPAPESAPEVQSTPKLQRSSSYPSYSESTGDPLKYSTSTGDPAAYSQSGDPGTYSQSGDPAAYSKSSGDPATYSHPEQSSSAKADRQSDQPAQVKPSKSTGSQA
jgi:actin-like ATPase involved in cell morphogenesis